MGKFVVKNTKTGVKFDLKAGNGEVIATSEVYTALKNCLNGVESVRKNSQVALVEDQTQEGYEAKKCPKFQVYVDKAGEFRFRLLATNGQNVCHSEGYTKIESCYNGIKSVINNAADAPVELPEE